MIIGKMEEIDKRFRFYQKSIFFSDLAMDQYERNSRKLNHDQAHSGSSLNNRQDLMNNSINKTSSTKPAKTMASIGNNTITFYSPKVLNRPMTVAPTQLVEPKTQFIENVKSSTKNADTYLGRLLKSENSKKFTPKPLLGRNPSLDSHLVNETFAKQSFENIKIKQHVFNHYSSNRANPPLLLTTATNTQFAMTNEPPALAQSMSAAANHSHKNSATSLPKYSSSVLVKKGNRLTNEDLNRYLAFQKKKSQYTNTSKLITNLNRLNQQKKLDPTISFKSSSMVPDSLPKSQNIPRPDQTFLSQSCYAPNSMNNYNFYFSNPSNKPSKSSKLGDRSPRPQITVQPCQRSLNNTKWTSITDSQEKLILNNLASNNYFKYTASKEEPNNNNNNNNLGYKHNLSSELILARSMTYDFKFKTDFVDSKLNLATALGKSGESLDKRLPLSRSKMASTDEAYASAELGESTEQEVRRADEEIRSVLKAEEKQVDREVKEITNQKNSSVGTHKNSGSRLDVFVYCEGPKLTAEEEMLVVKSKKKCDDWFERHFLYSNTSSPISDLNEF